MSVALLCAAGVGLSGCGYHFVGEHSALPARVRTLHIGTITNQSREHGLEKQLAFALEREIHVRGHFKLALTPDAGDAVLSGMIRDVAVRPVAFDRNDQAVQYELSMRVNLKLVDRYDGRTLWRGRNLRHTTEYSTAAQTVLTGAPQFQQGTLNTEDLRDPQLSRIQLAESERQRALTRLLERAARNAYNWMVEDF